MNLVARFGIRLWGIRRVAKDVLLAQVGAGEFRKLRVVARRSRCRVHALRRRGFLFAWRRLWRRPILVGGFIAVMIAFYVGGQYVWSVRLDGATGDRAEAILRAASLGGLRVGACRSEIEPAQVARRLLTEVDGLAWTGVELRGTVATVRVVEKDLRPQEAVRPRHLVAAVPGIIRSVVAIRGVPLVKSGDTVREGQVLISGVMPEKMAPLAGIGAGGPDAGEDAERFVTSAGNVYLEAEGMITARVWYEVKSPVPLREVIYKRSGRRRLALGVTVGGFSWWPAGKEPSKPFARRETAVAESRLRLGDAIVLPVTFHRQTDYELVPEIKEWTRSQAERESRRRAEEKMLKLLPKGADLVTKRFHVAQSGSGEVVEGSLTCEVLQEVGRPAGVSLGELPPPELQPPPEPAAPND